MAERVGLTTTVPAEVIFAGGRVPVDLNNVFITHPDAHMLVEKAETAGYPRNVCAWIKGIYSTVLADEKLATVIAVTQGDCSNTHALMETLQLAGRRIVPFAYPFDRDYDLLRLQIEKIIAFFGTDWPTVIQEKQRLDQIRGWVHELDRLTWQEDRVSGWHNHLYQVSCSDFQGAPEKFEKEVQDFVRRAQSLPPRSEKIRLAYIGVPPIFSSIYDYLELQGARVVYNETQRQFSMPFTCEDLVEQYRLYTYPYGIFFRLEDIMREVKKRKVDGIIHYAQSFCYRQIEDLIVRHKLDMPILTVEGDKPGTLDARTKVRLDAFLEMLSWRKG